MQRTDLEVLTRVRDWLNNQQSVWLCTIVSTYGSSPRPAGSLFAVSQGQCIGSISGGCIEQNFVAGLASNQPKHALSFITYGGSRDAISAVELPCGGSIRLAVEYLTGKQSEQIDYWFKLAQQRMAHRRLFCELTNSVWVEPLSQRQPGQQQLVRQEEAKQGQVCITYSDHWQLLILGISNVMVQVAKLAQDLGFRVRLVDSREEVIDAYQDQLGALGLSCDYDDPYAYTLRNTDQRTAVLGLSHDPKLDDIGVMAAFNTPAFFIGAMGSKRTSAKRRDRLARIGGCTEAQLARLHAPIGLDIGSKTPVEIAISVLAQILKIKAYAQDKQMAVS